MNGRHRLRQERERRGWTQASVARRLGTTELSISRWEQGITTPRPYYRIQLAELFEMTQEALGLVEAPSSVPESASTPLSTSPPAEAAGSKTAERFRILDPTLPLLSTTQVVGREQELAQLQRRLCKQETTFTVLHGMPGVGKTTLATCLVHDQQVRAHFVDGILWAGLGPHPTPVNVLSRWGRLLGLASAEMDALQDRAAWELALRTAIGERRLLLVLDDVWESDDAFALLVGGPHCSYLVTTRFPHLAHHLVPEGVTPVQELDTQQGMSLLDVLAPHVVGSEPQKVEALVQLVGGLPLALTLMGQYLRRHSGDRHPRRIRLALDRLHDIEERLRMSEIPRSTQWHPGLPAERVLSLEAVIELSEQHLDEAARQVLYALSVFTAKPASFSEEAACEVAACRVEVLDLLYDQGLLESAGPDRYCVHQIVADYARTRLLDPAPKKRLVAYCLHIVQTNAKNYVRLEYERSLIERAIELATLDEDPTTLVQLVCAVFPFLLSRGDYQRTSQSVQQASIAASALQDEHALVTLFTAQGKLLQKQGDVQGALACYQQGLDQAHRLGDQEGRCLLLSHLGWVTRKLGAYAQARLFLQEALTLARQVERPEVLCQVLNFFSALAAAQGNYSESEVYAQEGLTLARQLGDDDTTGFLLINLGVTLSAQGKHEQAIALFEEGLTLARQIGHKEWIGTLLINLGQARVYLGQLEQAKQCYQEGLTLAERTNHREWVGIQHVNLAEIAAQEGQIQEAEAHLRCAFEQVSPMGPTLVLAHISYEQGNLALWRGEPDVASEHYTAMARVLPEQDPEVEALVHFGYARVAAAQGRQQEARHEAHLSLVGFQAIGNHRAHEVQRWLHTGK